MPLYPIAQYIPRDILDQIYKTYTRPHFDLYDTVYDGHLTVHDAYRLETLQNRAGRLVTGALFRTSTDNLLQDLGWTKLKTRRQIHKLSLYQSFNDPKHRTPDYILSMLPDTRAQNTGRILRNASTHTTLSNRTSSFQKSFFVSTIKQWNNLPESFRTLSHTSFKRALTKQLGMPKPPAFHAFGSKAGNIIHTRLRTGMSLLNSHLFQIQKRPSPYCSCGDFIEDTRHFTLFCSNHTLARNKLFQNISRILNIEFDNLAPRVQLNLLLRGETLSCEESREVAYCFQNFLLNSRRFKFLQ